MALLLQRSRSGMPNASRQKPAASRVTSLKGLGILDAISTGKPVEVEYVPLIGHSTSVRVTCPAMELPGLEPESK
jgi:hypothetical protein